MSGAEHTKKKKKYISTCLEWDSNPRILRYSNLSRAPWTTRPPKRTQDARKVGTRRNALDKNTGKKKKWRIRVSIPVPRACEARTLPIELIPRGGHVRAVHASRTRALGQTWEQRKPKIFTGESGFRSLYLVLAKHALFRLS